MKLGDLLYQNRARIVDRWFGLIVETYPSESSRFIRNLEIPFRNPIGQTVRREVERLFDGIVSGDAHETPEMVDAALGEIVKLRAVQDFPPSEAVSFVHLLKPAVREVLGADRLEAGLLRELLELETRIDGLALRAFDVYAACLRRLFEVRLDEHRRANYMILRRAGMVLDGNCRT